MMLPTCPAQLPFLTVDAPWACQIAASEWLGPQSKMVEVRTWAPPRSLSGQWMAIHAAKGWSARHRAALRAVKFIDCGISPNPETMEPWRGCVVAVARVVGVVTASPATPGRLRLVAGQFPVAISSVEDVAASPWWPASDASWAADMRRAAQEKGVELFGWMLDDITDVTHNRSGRVDPVPVTGGQGVCRMSAEATVAVARRAGLAWGIEGAGPRAVEVAHWVKRVTGGRLAAAAVLRRGRWSLDVGAAADAAATTRTGESIAITVPRDGQEATIDDTPPQIQARRAVAEWRWRAAA